MKLNKPREAALRRLAEAHWHKEVFTRYNDAGEELANAHTVQVLIAMQYFKETYVPRSGDENYKRKQYKWLPKFYRSRAYKDLSGIENDPE